MELEITGKNENKTLQKQQVELKTKNAIITPSRKELRPKIAAMLNAKENLVVIGKIEHEYGNRESTIFVDIYENEEAMKKSAQYLINRDQGKKKDAKEETPAPKAEGEEAKPAEGKAETKPEKAAEAKPKAEEKPAKAEAKAGEKPAEAKPEEKPAEAKAEEKEKPAEEKPKEGKDEKKEGDK